MRRIPALIYALGSMNLASLDLHEEHRSLENGSLGSSRGCSSPLPSRMPILTLTIVQRLSAAWTERHLSHCLRLAITVGLCVQPRYLFTARVQPELLNTIPPEKDFIPRPPVVPLSNKFIWHTGPFWEGSGQVVSVGYWFISKRGVTGRSLWLTPTPSRGSPHPPKPN